MGWMQRRESLKQTPSSDGENPSAGIHTCRGFHYAFTKRGEFDVSLNCEVEIILILQHLHVRNLIFYINYKFPDEFLLIQ